MAPAHNVEHTDAPARRSFLAGLLAVGTSTVAALLAVPLIRFTLDPLRRTTSEVLWSDLGPVTDFRSGSAPKKVQVTIEQRDGWRKVLSEKPVYVLNASSGNPRVLSAVCPHLGCSIGWSDEKGQFVCPCHAGVFNTDGSLVSGPPPRGMDALEARIEGGRLQVRYQYFRQLVPTREVLA